MDENATAAVELSADDLAEIGGYVVSMCGAFLSLGHVNPALSTDPYIERPDSEAGGFVWDMFRTCLRGGDPDASRRLAEFASRHGILDLIAEAVAR